MNLTLRDALIPVYCVFAFLFILALVSYSPNDPGWTYIGEPIDSVHNIGGFAGSWFASVLFSLFGYLAYSLPAMMLISSWGIHRKHESDFFLVSSGWFLIVISGATICSLHIANTIPLPISAGGLLGSVIASSLLNVLSLEFITALAVLGFASGLAMVFKFSWLGLCDFIGHIVWTRGEKLLLSRQPLLNSGNGAVLGEDKNDTEAKETSTFKTFLRKFKSNGENKVSKRQEPHIGEEITLAEGVPIIDSDKNSDDGKIFVQRFMVAQAHMDVFGELPEDTDPEIAAKIKLKSSEDSSFKHPLSSIVEIPVISQGTERNASDENTGQLNNCEQSETESKEQLSGEWTRTDAVDSKQELEEKLNSDAVDSKQPFTGEKQELEEKSSIDTVDNKQPFIDGKQDLEEKLNSDAVDSKQPFTGEKQELEEKPSTDTVDNKQPFVGGKQDLEEKLNSDAVDSKQPFIDEKPTPLVDKISEPENSSVHYVKTNESLNHPEAKPITLENSLRTEISTAESSVAEEEIDSSESFTSTENPEPDNEQYTLEGEQLSDEELAYFASVPADGQTTAIKTAEQDTKQSYETTNKPKKHIDYVLPSTNILISSDSDEKVQISHKDLQEKGSLLEAHLNDFNVKAKVVAISPGPVITRFEVQPAAGVKVIRIANLAKDLARSLTVSSVRVVEVIPGKSTVGIEIPNSKRQMVRLGDVINSDSFSQAKDLALALGDDIEGNATIANLNKMPHLLVAGTTGSGKSVGVNSMLVSILFKLDPSQVRMILVDPKMLELSVYNGIPHLLTPVITDMKDAANGLRWCVAEMERRYRLMSKLGVRNLEGYNNKIRASKEGIPDPLYTTDPENAPILKTLPFLIIVIDEFADMMMIVGKKVEELIARIAQKARAAGIHLILATQRPSVDVITGLIKANIPTRIAFQVSSKIDSRTILDQSGADQLLGHGDMLYLPPGTSVPQRVHGAFVSDEEVHRVVDFWKSQDGPEYINSITKDEEEATEKNKGSDNEEQDDLYGTAVEFVIETQRVSISYVQRKLKIGYNRAARIIEAMEEQGVVSSMESNGKREVLISAPIEE